MKIIYKILFILLVLQPAALWAQETDEYDNNRIFKVNEIKLNDSSTVQLKQIARSEYDARKEQSAHLQQKTYKVVKDEEKARKMLGKKMKVIDVKTEGGGSYREHEITFKDGSKKYLDFESVFVAYYPELKILLFEAPGGYYSIDLYNNLIEDEVSPEYHSVSPDKQLRINAECPNDLVKEDFSYFIEKWNKSRKKYERIGNLFSVDGYGAEWSWTDNHTVLCTYIRYQENRKFYEMKIIEK